MYYLDESTNTLYDVDDRYMNESQYWRHNGSWIRGKGPSRELNRAETRFVHDRSARENEFTKNLKNYTILPFKDKREALSNRTSKRISNSSAGIEKTVKGLREAYQDFNYSIKTGNYLGAKTTYDLCKSLCTALTEHIENSAGGAGKSTLGSAETLLGQVSSRLKDMDKSLKALKKKNKSFG